MIHNGFRNVFAQGQALILRLKKDRLIYGLILFYLLGCWLATTMIGESDRFSFLIYPGSTVQITGLMAGSYSVGYALYVMVAIRPARPISYIITALKAWLRSEDVVRGVILLLVFTLFFSAFSSFKNLVPAFQPFVWDTLWIDIDKALHGGTHPWLLLQNWIGVPWLTWSLNVVYNLWFMIMFALFFWQLFYLGNEQRRKQFLISFILCWLVIGSVMAVLFSSVGPCFIDRLLPGQGEAYVSLFAYLEEVSQQYTLWALSTQDMLWENYRESELGVGVGIAAMPSMHVSIACLVFLLCRQYGRWPAILSGSFLVLILIGSVHLGWHYAIDGYVSILVTGLIWRAVGAFIARTENKGSRS